MAQTRPSAITKGPPPQKAGMSMADYEEAVGRLADKRGVEGVAVTSGNGKLVYINNGVEAEILNTYIDIISSIEYLCNVAARESDPHNRWQYIRFETDEYEMIVTIDPTHWIFLLAEPQEAYNGEKEEDDVLARLGVL